MSTKLSTDEVKHIAELAKLGLTDAETELFREQLSDILEYAEMLQRLDTDGISPTASVGGLGTVMRADIVTPSLAPEEAVANAPDQEDGYIKVLPILGRNDD